MAEMYKVEKSMAKTYIVNLDDDEFKIFEAENEKEAEIYGNYIAEALGSDFCDVMLYSDYERDLEG